MLSQEKVSEDVGRDVEQITKTPVQENVKAKEKDPKKVAAGKRLAEYNRRVKEALKREMKREAEKAPEEEETSESCSRRGWFPEMSFTTVISLVGIGLTAINMFMSYKSKPDPPPRLPDPQPPSEPQRPQPSKIPLPKMGMI